MQHSSTLRIRYLAPFVVAALFLAGCLPSSCKRSETRAVTAADSLSRHLAATLTPDTLELLSTLRGPGDAPLAYPRTVMFSDRGDLYVGDAERGSVHHFSRSLEWLSESTWDGADTPYLAGMRGDTVIAFNPVDRMFDLIFEGRLEASVPVLHDAPAGALQYAAASASAYFVKVVPKDDSAYISRIANNGAPEMRWILTDSQWRNAGMLRLRGDSLLSLSAFYPIADIASLTAGNSVHSQPLIGFDSPMLHRTRAFDAGKGRGAPLLMSSATWHDQTLYVLNLRPGWLRIDMYDSSGTLRRIFVDGAPVLRKSFYPMDLSVRVDGKHAQVAVAFVEPVPEVRVYSLPDAPNHMAIQPPVQEDL